MADCCDKIKDGIEQRVEDLRQAVYADYEYFEHPLSDIMFRYQGAYIDLPTGESVPSLRDLLGRVATPLDSGFGVWEWHNIDQPGKTVLILPEAPTKARVLLNATDMTPIKDYTLAGTTLTFVDGLDVGDLVTVKSYGA